ncbi:MAG: multicopper oxidase domain-containing protein [Verrucomicrobiia bacterium]
MKPDSRYSILKRTRLLGALLAVAFLPLSAAALNVTVVDGKGSPVGNFRWLLEEDNTTLSTPGVARVDSASLVIHKSHAPVVATGDSGEPIAVPDVAKRYALSIMADGYQVGGANIAPGQAEVQVVVNKHPIPTAQISVLVFEDHNPINNAPDAGEPGLPGFRIILADFAGGPLTQDFAGNPLGTTYKNINPETGAYEVDKMGDGFIYTDRDGKALIKYLPMGKYGVQAIPPTGSDWTGGHGAANVRSSWNQTATIEGTLTVDAWVKVNEPMVFMEGFGPGFYHVFFGFVKPDGLPGIPDPAAGANPATVTGTLRFNHFGRPPNNQQFVAGGPVTEGWVGLNEMNAIGAPGRGLYAAQCDPQTGVFSIPNVPPGTYQLVTWDTPLDALFGFHTITVPNVAIPNAPYDLGNVLTYRWFGTLQGSVFYDDDGDGFRDPGEEGIPLQNVNLRWRDGTVYMGGATDNEGNYSMQEVFPFFKWLVAEVDFARFEATGLTTVIDGGGGVLSNPADPKSPLIIPPDLGWTMPSDNVRNPQPQYVTLADGTIDINQPLNNENVTPPNNLSRTEQGPALTQGVQLFLNQNTRIDWGKRDYASGQNGGISGIVFYCTTRAENDPREAVGDPWEPGIPRVQVALYGYNAAAGIPADTLDNLTSVGGDATATRSLIAERNDIPGVQLADVDNHPLGWGDNPPGPKGPEDIDHNGNGIFDKGDAIAVTWTDSWDDVAAENPTLGAIQPNPPILSGVDENGVQVNNKPIIGADNYGTWNQVRPQVFDGGYAFNDIPVGMYVVQAVPPPNYKIQTEESLNVAFGDEYMPSTLAITPPIVGDYHQVGPILTLFPARNEPAPFAGKWRPLADRKLVQLANGRNAAADFHMYTDVPKTTRVHGFVLNDLTAEFNAFSPIYGEKGSPGWIPIAFRDWTGREVVRTHCDEHGTYTALLPSTYTVNTPMPSGVAPQMLTMVLNDPTLPDGSPDPHYNPAFATTPWTLHYFPGTVLYADTPIVPIAGFVGSGNKNLDVEPPSGTPVIKQVSVGAVLGPYLPPATISIVAIDSMGDTVVPNPDAMLNGTPGVPSTITRDFGFGTVRGEVTINGVILPIVSWNNSRILVRVINQLAAGRSGQLLVKRGDNGKITPMGLTITRGPMPTGVTVRYVKPPAAPDLLATPIQDAIDAANPGDLIIVSIGNFYENPIINKPVRLQGAGRGTVINANTVPADRLARWHDKVKSMLNNPPLATDPFAANEAPGIMVIGSADFGNPAYEARIDGFMISGATAGGGITVWNQSDGLIIRNNRIVGNQGTHGGGITLGMPGGGILYDNPNITIEKNQIQQNGGVDGGGGIAIYTGATGYVIRDNFIVGNFCRNFGGGISHQGVSPGGLIAGNTIAFNEVFYGVAVGGDGGGIYITGEQLVPGGLGTGSGSVTIINNLIQGNLAGSGHGGGIRAAAVNGTDIGEPNAQPPVLHSPEDWYALDIVNNIIVNNAAGYAGGGISLADCTRVRIVQNTIAHNDSTATSISAFLAGATDSTPQGAGIVSHQHSPLLTALTGTQYPNPVLENNILWENKSYFYRGASQGLEPAPIPVSDLYPDPAVIPAAYNPVSCLVTTPGVLSGNVFVRPYEKTLYTALVADEAGNNISIRFDPARLYESNGQPQGDYHLAAGSPAINASTATALVAYDFDRQVRPEGGTSDIGADEVSAAVGNAVLAATAPIVGPPADGAVPPITVNLAGAGVPPGPMVRPPPLNPLPGHPTYPLLDPEPLVDSDGDGNPNNDFKYMRLGAGDGFAKMGDGNELYTFGFVDLTAVPEAQAMGEGILKAQISAPTLVLQEGQHFYLDLLNYGMAMRPDLFDPHTVHFHGFPQAASVFDGEPFASLAVNVGGTLRYYYKLNDPGTFIYHCHMEATEHMEMGMLGSVIVRPRQNFAHVGLDPAAYPTFAKLPPSKGQTHQPGYKYAYNDGDGSTYYDVEKEIQVGAFDGYFHRMHIAVQPLPFATLDESYPMINGRGYPHTVSVDPIVNQSVPDKIGGAPYAAQVINSRVEATKGQRILLRISSVALADYHTITVLGIPMRVVGKDANLLRGPSGIDLSYETTSITLGGGEMADVILDTTNVERGTYFLYDTRMNHLCNEEEDYGGMMTEIIIQ